MLSSCPEGTAAAAAADAAEGRDPRGTASSPTSVLIDIPNKHTWQLGSTARGFTRQIASDGLAARVFSEGECPPVLKVDATHDADNTAVATRIEPLSGEKKIYTR